MQQCQIPFTPGIRYSSDIHCHIASFERAVTRTSESFRMELIRLWDFVEATSPGVCRNDPNSWYPSPQQQQQEQQCKEAASTSAVDPWPHSGWKFLPDMCQSFQAGWLFGSLREKLADRVFEPIYGTHQLHSSKEGFTFHRPTASGVATNGAEHPVLSSERPLVCGKIQRKARGEHFDQCASDTGLHCIQSSTALIDQTIHDGCFQCWPKSHKEHPRLTKDIWRGRSDWVPLTDGELETLELMGMAPKKIPVSAGDVILWRSDLVHCGVGPSTPRSGFRAVSYTCMLPAAMTPLDVWEGKVNEYLTMQTGDHRPNVKSRHFAPPKKEKEKKKKGQLLQKKEAAAASEKDDDATNIKIVRGQYFADGPPILTLRQAELYGLVPYDRGNGEKDLTIHSNVRILPNTNSLQNNG
eukprot:CAMPEP_0172328770 /NCGR_PEP_ID=MMETSP1058-20130122/60520_1 /TAXON_ID=83371 /ORGANISM="Detonula confervacea, Strain CCMP 353" /LENGTH=410 /DNA_ID=CAMNT_0013045899 /DNA_START=1905 /DNA_END=3138 /DNA_ORIENTATION=-